MPLLIHPCYLLQRRGRVGGGGQVGGKGWGQGPAERGGSEGRIAFGFYVDEKDPFVI